MKNNKKHPAFCLKSASGFNHLLMTDLRTVSGNSTKNRINTVGGVTEQMRATITRVGVLIITW